MNHEFEDVLREADEFIAEMEMDIEKRRLDEEEAEENLILLEKVLGLS